MFALLRLTEGSFKFQTNTEPLNSVEPLDVTPLMEQAEERLAEWPGIAEVVPSLSSELVLQESINHDIVLSPEQWRLIASIGSGRRVADLIEAGDLGEFDGCKAIKRLVETGLVHVVSSEVEPEPEALVQDVPALVQDVPALVQDVLVVPEVPAAEATDDYEHAPGWSDGELTSLSEVWNDDDKGEAESVPAEEESREAGQPVNRGLLLKFLGSARS